MIFDPQSVRGAATRRLRRCKAVLFFVPFVSSWLRDKKAAESSLLPVASGGDEVDHRLDLIVGVECEAAGAIETSRSFIRMRHPIGKHDALTMADISLSFETKAGKEPLIGGAVGHKIVQSIDQAESIAESHVD